jgi:hypothetical protein
MGDVRRTNPIPLPFLIRANSRLYFGRYAAVEIPLPHSLPFLQFFVPLALFVVKPLPSLSPLSNFSCHSVPFVVHLSPA